MLLCSSLCMAVLLTTVACTETKNDRIVFRLSFSVRQIGGARKREQGARKKGSDDKIAFKLPRVWFKRLAGGGTDR